MDATQLLRGIRLIPVVVIEDMSQAVPLARTLLRAGINTIEVTLRTKQALPAIEAIAAELPEMIIGAGSITSPAQFDEIIRAGAQYAVSPGHTDALLDAASLPYLPGAVTPSDCLYLRERGYRLQKFFPAEAAGGLRFLEALAAPIQDVCFCPTGGINLTLAKAYLERDFVACIGGSWFVDRALMADGHYDDLQRNIKATLAELGHA